ncbi:MAG: hypothetical protein MJ203_04715 [archaeon]|nr:hypothetical protein [archaeon]
MLEKEVKQYKRGNSFTYRIDLSKKDEFEGGEKIMILRLEEYESIINEIEDLKLQLDNSNNTISKLKENHSEANSNINKIIEEHNSEIDVKNKEIMSLVKENKADVIKFNDDMLKERLRSDELVHSKDEDIKSLNEKLSEYHKDLMDKNNLLTAYRLLIERYKSMSFLDRLLNRLPDEKDLKPADAIETYAILDSSED